MVSILTAGKINRDCKMSIKASSSTRKAGNSAKAPSSWQDDTDLTGQDRFLFLWKPEVH